MKNFKQNTHNKTRWTGRLGSGFGVLTGQRKGFLAASLVASLILSACGKKESSSSGEGASSEIPTSTGGGTGASPSPTNADTARVNTLATAVPGNLALLAFPTASGSALMLEGLGGEGAFDGSSGDVFATGEGSFGQASSGAEGLGQGGEEGDYPLSKLPPSNPPKTLEAEVKENMQVLQGRAESCLPKAYTQSYGPPTEETCYQFDQDMIYGSTAGNSGPPRVMGTKDGKNSKGEACLVAFARSQILKIKDPLDRSQAIINAALCQAAKDEKSKAKGLGQDENAVDLLPKNVGDTLDLSPYLKNAMQKASRPKDTVTSIKMTRLADVGGQAVYQTLFNIVDDQGNVRFYTLNHSPKDKNNDEYNGILYFAVKPPKGKADPQAGPGAQADLTFYVSMSYLRSKDAATSLVTTSYEARIARFKNGTDPIESTGVLNFNTGADFTPPPGDPKYGRYKKADGSYYNQDNEAASGLSYMTFSNTEDKDGKSTSQRLGFWQNPGSSYIENARGMIFDAKPNSQGLLEGCANSGSASVNMASGISIRRMLNEGAQDPNISLIPRGFYHPFMHTEAGGPQAGTVTANGTGEFKYKKVTAEMTHEWGALKAPGPEAVDFVTKQNGVYFTSQCFKQNASGSYEIDAEKTKGVDGFDLIKDTDSKVILPPKPPEVKLYKEGPGKIDFKPKEITQISASSNP